MGQSANVTASRPPAPQSGREHTTRNSHMRRTTAPTAAVRLSVSKWPGGRRKVRELGRIERGVPAYRPLAVTLRTSACVAWFRGAAKALQTEGGNNRAALAETEKQHIATGGDRRETEVAEFVG